MRQYIRQQMADREKLQRNLLLRPLAPWLLHPGVWSLNRRSVAGGVAVGLFCGVLPNPFQIFVAALISIGVHVNLPAAALATLYTNPLTFIPVYLLGLKLGLWIFEVFGAVPTSTTDDGVVVEGFPPPPAFEWSSFFESTWDVVVWMAGLGWPLIVGLLAMGLLLAVVGYALVWLGWGVAVSRSRQRRAALRRATTRSQRSASEGS